MSETAETDFEVLREEMVEVIAALAGEDGKYTAGSMYRAWKGWSFADKKQPSPWLTFLVLRVLESARP